MNDIYKGLIQIYTGDGKGKTTAALGQAIRAAGHNMKIVFIQFMKGIPTGEHHFMSNHPAFEIIQISKGNSFSKSQEQLGREAQDTLSYAELEIHSGKYEMVVLDEILTAVNQNLITTKQVLDLMDHKPKTLEIILTGRNAPPEIIQRADLVTEMLMIKHPYTEGIEGRRGIEF